MPRSRLLLVLIAAFLALQEVAGAVLWRDRLWGSHSYGYLPAWAGLLSAALFAAATIRVLRGQNPLPGLSFDRMDRLRALAGLALAAGCFWFLRIRHDLLGDALPITHNLPQGVPGHPRQPLAKWLQLEMYRIVEPWISGFGGDAPEVAAKCVALASALFGLLFLVLAWKLARRLEPDGASAHERLLFSVILVLQGSALLFFGYIENYTSYYLAVALYLFLGVSFLQRRLPLFPAGIVVALLVGMHLSSFVFWPSFLLLVVLGLREPARRIPVLRDLVLTGATLMAMAWWLNRIDPQFHLVQAYRDFLALGRGNQGLAYLLSAAHLRDWYQEQLLAGPITLLFWLPLLPFWFREELRNPVQGFLLAAAACCLAATFVADEPLLGYARDWDLFLPAILPVAVSALALGWRLAASVAEARIWLGYAAVVSLLGFAPWVALNMSEARSLQRMAELPLGLGRAAVVVGNWHLRHEDPATAERWLRRALEEYPANNTAMSLLGRIAVQRGQVEEAIALYQGAIELQPRKVEYRERITRLLTEQGQFEASLPHFEVLVREQPSDGGNWLRFAEALRASGQAEASTDCYRRAATALSKALRLRPDDYQLNMDLGTVQASLGDAAAAEPYLRKALEARPASAAALYQLAGVLVAQGRPAEAKPFLEELLRVQPAHPQRQAIERWLSSSP